MRIVKIIMERDGLAEQEARMLVKEASEEMMQMIAEDPNFDEVEFMSDWFGLESDYIMDLI